MRWLFLEEVARRRVDVRRLELVERLALEDPAEGVFGPFDVRLGRRGVPSVKHVEFDADLIALPTCDNFTVVSRDGLE